MREERKVVTALFADLVGSTALSERLDPEDARDVLGAAVNAIIEVVENLGGTIKDLAGDGVLALFGAPIAHEDDAIRAVNAGLRIAEAISGYDGGIASDRPLSVRVGIDSGLVVVGPVGTGGRIEYGATGDAVNTAARLQACAEPGTVLVGERTRRHIEHLFRWRPSQEFVLKGKDAPVRASVVEGPVTETRSASRTAQPDATTLGRERELDAIRSALARVVNGGGTSLAITGDAGVGKSRLVAELKRELEDRRVNRMEGACLSSSATSPYGLWRDLLRDWFESHARDPTNTLRDALIESVAGFETDPEQQDVIDRLSPETLQHETFAAIESFVHEAARNAPLIVLLEDLHWGDSASIQVAERLSAVTATTNLLIVATARPEKGHASQRLVETLGQRGIHVQLEGLDDAAARALLARLAPSGWVAPDVEDAILRRAEGNPFYLEEFVRSLQDADGAASVELPESVERLMQSRLDRIPGPARDVIDAAAVVGRAFSIDVLERIAESEPDLHGALDELATLNLVVPSGSGDFEFKHALIHEAAYRSLLRKRRRTLHHAAAVAIEDIYSAVLDQHHSELAFHYEAAGEASKALDYHARAARAAARLFSVREARDHFDAALRLAEEVDGEIGTSTISLRIDRGRLLSQTGDLRAARADFERAAQDARSNRDAALEMEALNELGFAFAGAADYRAAIPELERALEIATRLGDETARVSILSRLSIVHTNQLRFTEAFDRGREALRTGRALADGRSAALALDSLAVAAALAGDISGLEEISRELIDIHDANHDLWYLQFALYQSSYAPFARASWAAAMQRLESAYEVNRRIRDAGNVPVYLSTLAWMHRAQADYEEALDLGRRAVEAAQELGHNEYIAWTCMHHGWTLEDLLLFEDAEAAFSTGLVASQEAAATNHLFCCLGHLAYVRFELGHTDDARSLARDADEMLEQITAPPGMAYLQGAHAVGAMASVYTATGDAARAGQLLDPFVTASAQAPWIEMHALTELALGRSYAAVGEARRAVDHARGVAKRSESFGLAGIAWRAHALVGTVASDDSHRAAAEQSVNHLAAGLSDETIRGMFRRRAYDVVEKEGGP